jgi:secreted PhoX family phosphatase
MGRGAWENVTQLDTGTTTHVAFALFDDTSPIDADGDGSKDEAAPLYLYVGEKNSGTGGFLDQNGLENGKLYAWASDTGETLPSQFNTSGTLAGSFVEIDNSRNVAEASDDGSTGYDSYGYPIQTNLWNQAINLGSFGFSRPEDGATNPFDGSEFVFASTGVDTYDVDPATGNGTDTFGTVYTMDVDFSELDNPTGALSILYDGNADPTRALRSPDNVDWADSGLIYVQEDKAEDTTLTGVPLFGPGAANPNEAGIVQIDPDTGELVRIANIDRSVVLDGSIPNPADAVDVDAGTVGEWESSGILDVSTLFGTAPGTTFVASVQAHGIDDQTQFNADSSIVDTNLTEGGQLVFLDLILA